MPQKQLGRYNVIAELGRGAMGVLYKAHDPLLDRVVAIKTLRIGALAEEGAAFEQRFYREAKSAGRLNHPNIVTIYDVGKSGELAYIAMELLEGRSLRDVLDSGAVLSFATIADIAMQIAMGLLFAHQHDVVHRDIKPANIMVLKSGVVKITDFGIALLPTGSRTVAGQVFGSPKYMAPEQARGGKTDGRSDLFSLGAVLYEMLTGVAPFTGDDVHAVLYKVINEMPAAPTQRKQNIPAAFDAIVARALAKNPADRYQSAQELIQDLGGYAGLGRSKAAAIASLPAIDTLPTAKPRATLVQDTDATLQIDYAADVPTRSSLGDAVPADQPREALHNLLRSFPGGKPWRLGAAILLAAALIVGIWRWGIWQWQKPIRDPVVEATPAIPTEPLVRKELRYDPPRAVVPEAGRLPAEKKDIETAAAAPKPEPPVRTKVAPSPAGEQSTARLVFAVSPWGEIRVNGKSEGIAPPLSEIKLPPGKYSIEIRNSTFAPHRRTVELAADANIKIRHKFQ